MLKLLSLILFLTASVTLPDAFGQDDGRQRTMDEAEQFRQQLQSLERELGRYDMQLLEPMNGLISAALSLDQFAETDEILDRAIQILRINEGLFTESQFPYLILTVRSNVRQGNWQEANAILEHLAWLYTNKHIGLDTDLVYELLQLSDFHLEGVAGDNEAMQAYHFRSSERISWVAVQVGELLWGEADTRLIELYYRIARQNFLQHIALKQGGEVAADLRQVAPDAGWMRPRQVVQRLYYQLGLEMFRRMQQVYFSMEPPDLEAIAMVDLYQVDWQVLFGEGDPYTAYQLVYENLLEAGASSADLQALFSRPQVLPIKEFFATARQAREALTTDSQRLHTLEGGQVPLVFVEWSSTFPNVQLPLEEPLLLEGQYLPMRSAQIAIKLDGTEEVSRWIRGSYVTRTSVSDGIQWINRFQDQEISLRELSERLHYLNFRPVLEKGVPQLFEGILEYRYFPVGPD